MGINSTEVAYNFGQLGSVFNDGTAAITPPTNKVFVAITMLADTTFDTTGGLVSDVSNITAGLEYITTASNDPAHNATVGSGETTTTGGGGIIVDASNTFPKGITIYGRWTEIDLDSGMVVAYIGD